MSELLTQTLASAEAFWTAVAALAAILALGFLLLELPKLKKEIALHKVEGFKYAREQLGAEDFHLWCRLAVERWKKGDDEFPEELYGELTAIFGRLDYVARLVQLGLVDKSLLFYFVGDDLATLEAVTRNFETRTNSKIPNIRASYPAGYELLRDGAKDSRRSSRKIFARLKNSSR